MKKNSIFFIFGIVFLIGSFLFLRLYKIEKKVNFSMDQGLFLLRSWEIWQNKEITLIGPTASPVVNNRQFFQGPIIYYSIIGLMSLSGWDVVRSSYFLVGFNLLSLLLLYLTTKKIFNKKIALFTFVINVFLPFSINFSNFIWNPNILMTLTPVFLFLGFKSWEKNKNIWFIYWGTLGGICLQYHFQFGLIILATFIFLWFRRLKIKKILSFVWGLFLGYFPLILFDLRNNFYNIKTFGQWLCSNSNESFSFQIHYFLSFVPLICIGIGWFLEKIKNKIIIIMVFLVFIIYSFNLKLNEKNSNWNYVVKKEIVANIIENGCPKNFNVATTIKGDTRAYDLRYLLNINGCKSMGVEEYPSTEKLFLIAPVDRPPETETVWEVSSLGKFKINRQEKLTENILFWELEKIKAN